MDVKERALQAHEKWGGKIEVVARCEVNSKDDLSIAYTPGVAEPCLKIKDDPSLSYTYTRRHNLVAVITDGTAVLGLGDIGPIAGMPVMEGKCVQGVRRRGRVPALCGFQGCGRDCTHHSADLRLVWRHQPRGYRGSALL